MIPVKACFYLCTDSLTRIKSGEMHNGTSWMRSLISLCCSHSAKAQTGLQLDIALM